MALIVQKYGGSSLRDAECIGRVAGRIQARLPEDDLVVVVSAQGSRTNDLLSTARHLNPKASKKDLDKLLLCGEHESVMLLCVALQALKLKAVPFFGEGTGIFTNAEHSCARILKVNSEAIRAAVGDGAVAVVAGFQGQLEDGTPTTLGRGGGDLSAVAIAASLGAECCEIYTDVQGVYTADPRVVKAAHKIDKLAYAEMLEMASGGAGVLQSRAVQLAQKQKVPVEVKSSFSETDGTLIGDFSMESASVRSINLQTDQTRVSLTELPEPEGLTGVFEALGSSAISVDLIVQNVARKNCVRLSFTIDKADTAATKEMLAEHFRQIGQGRLESVCEVTKLSIVGIGMRSEAGVAARFFRTLNAEGIQPEIVSTSEFKILVALAPHQATRAANALHKAFGLDKP